MENGNSTATFVMPHYLNGDEESRRHLDETLESIYKQTDANWNVVIIDDLSPSEDARNYVKELAARDPEKIHLITKETNDGPGHCRNVGVNWAYEKGSPFVLFIDADDLADPRRLEVARKIFNEDPKASVVYTTFRVVDEESNSVPEEKLSPSIIEIIDGHKHNPPQGENAWIEIGTTKGYTNLTSATAVRTEIAKKFPFPPERVSEDSHTWMRYSAGGDKFVYTPEAPTRYRIPQNTAGSSSRSREGGRHEFYRTKARVDTDGFTQALELALEKGKIDPGQKDELMIKFLIKLGDTLAQENEIDLARDLVKRSIGISKEFTETILSEKAFTGQTWTLTD